ncbi:MAG: tetratricopeptide repeat protein [Candidatus Korobacteraceae bacterium]
MTLNRVLVSFAALLLAGAVSGVAQNNHNIVLTPVAPDKGSQASGQENPDTSTPTPADQSQPPAGSQDQSGSAAPAESAPPKQPDQAAAYYHFTLAHMYEEMASMYGRTDYATKAVDEYRLAIDNDPTSDYLNAGLAELYAKTGRIRDAVLEAQDILKRDGNNLEARRLLGRIYLRSLGDMQAGTQSQEILKLAIEQYEQIVKLDPKSVEDHLLLGRLYRLNNELLKSEDEFKTAVKIQPDSEEAVTTLAYLYNEEGDSGRALQVLSAIPDSSRTAKLYSALGFTYEQQKDYKKAIDAYRRATELDRDNLDSVRGLAQNLMNDGQTDAALEQYKVIADADPSDAQTYMHIAEIDRRNGQFDQALEALKKASAVVPDSLEVQYNIALIDEAQGKYEDAIQILEQLLQKTEHTDGDYSVPDKNNRAVFLERLGTVYREDNKYQQSVDAFHKMLELGDENAIRGYQEIIDTYRDNKQWQMATDVAAEAAKKYPNDRGLQMVSASQEADMGKADVAIEHVKSLLKGNADDREVYIALAQMYSRVKDWPNAEQNITKAIELSSKPEDKDYATFVQGSIYERQKKYEPAEEAFRKVLADDPKNAMALNYLGYMLADRDTRLEEALGYIRRAVALDPQNGAYLDSLGWAYYKLGKYDLAEENLRRASERINTDPTVHQHLGELYQKTGRLKLAAVNYERSLEEWNKTIPAEVDQDEVAKLQKELETTRVKLAKQSSATKQ